VYATLFAKNKDTTCAKDRTCSTFGPGTTVYDVPTSFGGTPEYRPDNFGKKNYGIITMRQALAGSLNIPAVKALSMAGIEDSVRTARALGITTLNDPAQYGLSLVLGTGEVKLVEMANAYESFANGGQHFDQTPILKLYDQKGVVLEDNSKPDKPKQALDSQVAYLMADVLSDNDAKKYVFANDLTLNNMCGNNNASGCVHAGAKTGTTEHFNDAWTIGFTKDIVAAVWVGNNDNAPMNTAAADIAAPVWRNFMNKMTGGKPNEAFTKDSSVKTVTLDKKTGRSKSNGTTTTTTDIFPSWYVPMSPSSGRSAVVDKVSGLLATECTPELAKETKYSSAILPEITKTENSYQYSLWLAALNKAGYASSADLPTNSDNVHSCSDSKPVANITGLGGGGPYAFQVQVTAGTFTPNKLEVFFDDQIVSTQVISGSGTYDVNFSPTSAGTHTIKAVVTDDKLYQSSDSQTVTVTNVGAPFSNEAPNNGSLQGVGSVTFSWSAENGAESYSLYVDGTKQGGSTDATSKAVTLGAGAHTWYVKSNKGTQTSPWSVTLTP
jgi:membrane carboxypeptidase/penicillin-binding protein PbpC